MKIAFFKKNELNEVLSEVMKEEFGANVTCEVSFSDELETEIVLITQNGVLKDTIQMWDTLTELSAHLNVVITNYDVIEVGDFGEGFAFFF